MKSNRLFCWALFETRLDFKNTLRLYVCHAVKLGEHSPKPCRHFFLRILFYKLNFVYGLNNINLYLFKQANRLSN